MSESELYEDENLKADMEVLSYVAELTREQLLMVIRQSQKEIEELKEECRNNDSRQEVDQLSRDNDEAIGALDHIRSKLEIMREVERWSKEPGSFLKMGLLPNQLQMVIEAMQKDLLVYTENTLSKLTLGQVPF